MSARTDLAAALAVALPDLTVHPYPVAPDTVTDTTVVMWQQSVAPSHLTSDQYEVELVLNILAAADKPAAVEDELEAGLETVVTALESFPALHWTRAERVEVGNRPAYKIDILTAYQKE